MRATATATGLLDPYIVKFDTRDYDDDPADSGRGCVRPVPSARHRHLGIHELRQHMLVEYDALVRESLAIPSPEWTRHEAAVPMWDNTAAGPAGATVLTDSTRSPMSTGCARSTVGHPNVVASSSSTPGTSGRRVLTSNPTSAGVTPISVRLLEPCSATNRTTSEPDAEDRIEVVCGPTFTELYLDIYERYVRTQRRLTSIEAAIRREVDRRTELLNRELLQERGAIQPAARTNSPRWWPPPGSGRTATREHT